MYALSIQRDFIARHYLTVEDAGTENEPHSHHYKAELLVEGEELDSQGYVVDIEDLGAQFDGLIDEYRDKVLNDLDAFEELNPSIEHFSRILCEEMDERLYAPNVTAISIKLWENDSAWVAYDLER